ncbi:uncharacterized protein LOC113227168 [Hyposmocoma kahamanoa]|uniref:uncharacterized protein LOC113227168 n=1 Tax=Hyposmocoma kahamanoa TaxID=1477025 RepID=UPI000E6D9F02|nr:uncharacterized protein LOC113227168 [Hyposmocoma kahamanoa]
MALMRSKSNAIPEDGIVMDEMEATTYVWELVTNWETTSDTWALRYGPVVLGSLNAVSGIIINQHFRRKLKLGNYGYFSSVIPVSILPGMLTALFHRHLHHFRTNSLKCLFQFASRYCTYRVPALVEGPKVVFQFLRKITRPLTASLTALTALQFIASSAVTYFEMKNNFTMRKKMVEMENKLLAE